MNHIRNLAAVILTASAIIVSGCNPGPEALYQADQGAENGAVTEGPKTDTIQPPSRAAQALSVTNNPSVSAATEPYRRALLCRHGISELTDRLQSLAEISDEQRRSADQASSYFQQYLDNAAQAANKSASDVQDDLEQLALDQTDPADNVRVATACLKALENGTL